MANSHQIIAKQRIFFEQGKTRDLQFRIDALRKLKKAIIKNRVQIYNALKTDLNKAEVESYETEVGIVLAEINCLLRNLTRWAKPEMKITSIVTFPSVSHIHREPYGLVLVMSPWNYPLQLSLIPLIGAIAAGNCVVLKPSNYAPATANVIEKIIKECYDEEFVSVFLGGREQNQDLLQNKYDFICFTGGYNVGKLVMQEAAKTLTPVCLELGGKSPCIIDKSADLRHAAMRLAWGKCLNAGQTCVAPDYLLIHEDVKEKFLEYLKKYFIKYFGENAHENPDYPKIINKKHYERIKDLIASGGDVCFGGKFNDKTLQISPTLIDNVNWDMDIMREEIFGPVMPILTFSDIEEVRRQITNAPDPLALYLFTRTRKTKDYILTNISFGGGCVNEVISHMITPQLPFGGVGASGMGSYHGKYSFETFTHKKSVLQKSNIWEPFMKYAPYNNFKYALLRIFIR